MSEFKKGIEIELKQPFNVVRETLERIGIMNFKERIITPSVYLLHKQGKYYLVHFKELMELDGKQTNFNRHDIVRLLNIAYTLNNMGVITIIDDRTNGTFEPLKAKEQFFVNVLPYKEKENWTINHKYRIGKKYS